MMVFVLTGAGLVALIAGLVAIVAGLPILEFSYGNTLITAGAISTSCGLVVIALAQILRELRRQTSSIALSTNVAHDEFPDAIPAGANVQPGAASFPPPRATQIGATHDTALRRDA